MDRLHAMQVFTSIADSGSLSAAGRKLRMPLPTVSRKLSELEAHLNARLLLRTTRHLGLTDAGRRYLAECKRILEAVSEAERGAAGEYRVPTGELRLTAPIVFGRLHVLPVLAEFLKAYPQVDGRLLLHDRSLNLLDEQIDVALRIGVLPDSSLMARRVGTVRRVVCASPAYLERRGAPKKPQELPLHDCVSFSTAAESGSWRFICEGREQLVAPRARLAVNTAEAAIDAAVAGVGITRVLSYQIDRTLQAGALVRLLRKYEAEPLPVNLVHAGQRHLPLKLRAFLDYAAPRLRARLAGSP